MDHFAFQGVIGLTYRLSNPNIRVEKDVLVYDMNSFIGDVGGFLGLLMGLSLLDVYKGVANSFQWLVSCAKKRKK